MAHLTRLSRARNAPFVAVAALIVAAILLIVAFTGSDPAPSPTPAPTVTVKVDGPDANTALDQTLVLNEDATRQLRALQAIPEGAGELSDPLREPSDPSRTPPGVLEGPLAAQEFPGCRTRFVSNYSSRNGVKPQVIVWHQTVSRDRPGWEDQDALTAYASQRSSGVSWHFLIGRTDGNCTFSVPLHMKAWTQGNANPFSFGIEVQAYGDEPSYVQEAGERRLLAVTRELGRRFGIPMREGRVENCRVVRSGIVEHADLGACGGGHADVTPWDTRPLLAKLARQVTGTDRVTCRKLNWWRTHGRPHGKPEQNAVRRRKALDARGVRCTSRGPVLAVA